MISTIPRSLRFFQHSRFASRVGARFQVSSVHTLLHNNNKSMLATNTPETARNASVRYLSTADPQYFKPKLPTEITTAMAEGIQDTTLFYLRHGISHQRLKALSEDEESPLVMKWQRMMEIYLSTQVYVISGLGYSGDEKGLQDYTQQLAEFIQNKCDDDDRDMFRKVGQEIWRELLIEAFHLDADNIKSISIVDARNIMHKVSSKMQEPDILMKIQKECAKLPETMDIDMEMAQKHQVLQNIIVNDVYMGGSPCLVEVEGFGSGEKGYAHLQCVMAQYEADPLIAQYAGSAMVRIWEAAGLDLSSIQNAGNIRVPGGGGTTL